MLLSIIGFIAVCWILGSISLGYYVIMLNCLGQYNIGGVPNSKGTKLLVLIGLCVLVFLWYQVYIHCPFTVSMSK